MNKNPGFHKLGKRQNPGFGTDKNPGFQQTRKPGFKSRFSAIKSGNGLGHLGPSAIALEMNSYAGPYISTCAHARDSSVHAVCKNLMYIEYMGSGGNKPGFISIGENPGS